MGRKRKGRIGCGKLLDAWDPPDGAGEPIGCLATSFTFSPEFFEEECLARFLRMQSDPREDGPAYVIEREEKMAALSCAAAIVDQHHAKGSRSLRWDLLPVRPASGILHAKISLLHWTNLARLIVASANITEDGYRRNREVFGVLDYRPDGEAPIACLTACLDFLRSMARENRAEGQPPTGAWQRTEELLARIQRTASEWGLGEGEDSRQPVRVRAVLVGPGSPDAFRQVTDIWPANTPPNCAEVVSPFFDPPEAENRPARQVWECLRKRGEAEVWYYTTAEDVPGEEAILLHGPKSLLGSLPDSERVGVGFGRVLREEDEKEDRPLHAKGVWLSDDRRVLYMVGSSNFTTPGLGLGRTTNLEANVAYVIDAQRDPDAYKALEASFVATEELDPDKLRFQSSPLPNEDGPDSVVVLPPSFGDAIYDCGEGHTGEVTLTFLGRPPGGWRICTEDAAPALFCDEDRWQQAGCPGEMPLPWDRARPPSGFVVTWTGAQGSAWWPVNVSRPEALPPPDELRDLPMEVLLDVLSSARPLHRVLGDYLRRRRQPAGHDRAPELDPHKRVDTSGFLLQRSRRVSWALAGLGERLRRPAPTPECLAWRLRGPFGVTAVAKAIGREGRSEEERGFLLAELALELCRVQPEEAPGCMPASEVRKELRLVAQELAGQVRQDALTVPQLREYVQSAFAAAGEAP